MALTPTTSTTQRPLGETLAQPIPCLAGSREEAEGGSREIPGGAEEDLRWRRRRRRRRHRRALRENDGLFCRPGLSPRVALAVVTPPCPGLREEDCNSRK